MNKIKIKETKTFYSMKNKQNEKLKSSNTQTKDKAFFNAVIDKLNINNKSN